MIKYQEILIEGPQRVQDLSFKQVDADMGYKELEIGISVNSFAKEKQQRRIQQEYIILKQLTETETHKQNFVQVDEKIKQLNRYTDIIPYQHTLATLQNGDYINASYIDSVIAENQFIAAQGPLPHTAGQFWQQILEQNISIIIMLCKVQEARRSKCFQYFPTPATGNIECYPFTIELLSEEQPFTNLFVRRFLVKTQNVYKQVFHLQCTAWPDHGSPNIHDEFNTIQYIIQTMKKNIYDFPGVPIMVHCSAGVGRTGTILSIFNCMQTMEAMIEKEKAKKLKTKEGTPRISIFGVVRRMREQRFLMVQSAEQYEFIYDYMDKAIKNLSQEIPLQSMPGYKQSKTKFTISGKFDTNQYVSKCFNCITKPYNPSIVIKCNHKFCDNCIIESFKGLLSTQNQKKEQLDKHVFECPICGKSTTGEEWKIQKHECIFKCPICGKDTLISEPKFMSVFQGVWDQFNKLGNLK